MSHSSRRLYLACYDIADDKRLKQALKAVRCFATGGQKSVHEVWLTNAEKQQLLATMTTIVDSHHDQFLLVRLDPRQQVHTLGVGITPHHAGDWFYLG